MELAKHDQASHEHILDRRDGHLFETSGMCEGCLSERSLRSFNPGRLSFLCPCVRISIVFLLLNPTTDGQRQPTSTGCVSNIVAILHIQSAEIVRGIYPSVGSALKAGLKAYLNSCNVDDPQAWPFGKKQPASP